MIMTIYPILKDIMMKFNLQNPMTEQILVHMVHIFIVDYVNRQLTDFPGP